MFIYQAVIEASTPYEELADTYNEHGADVRALTARQLAAASRIAPESAWEHVGEAMTCTVDGVTYTMYMSEVLLVC